MGTSTVHRSPLSSPHWRIVNNLYRNPTVERERLLAEIFRAAEEPYVAGLRGVEVSDRLGILLTAWPSQRKQSTFTEALSLARALVEKSRDVEGSHGLTSFYSDLANRALHSTVVAVLPDTASGQSRKRLVQAFLANVVATCIDHVVSRDLSAHLGTKNLPNTKAVLELTRLLKAAARRVATSSTLSGAIDAAARAPEKNWSDLIASAWAIGASTSERKSRRDRE